MPDDAPVAPTRPVERTHHGDTVTDEYDWLRDRDDPEVAAYLSAENDWCEQRTRHLRPLVDKLLADLDARTVETELSVPELVHHELNGQRRTYWYYTRTAEGQQYPMLSRLPVVVGAPPDPWSGPEGEEILFDGNVEAQDSEFAALGPIKVSPDGRLLAYGLDKTGDEHYTVSIRDLATQTPIDQPLTDVGAQLAWVGSSYLCYARYDDARRPYAIVQHRLGTAVSEDEVIVTEEDQKFRLSVRESRDRRWLLVSSSSYSSSETRLRSVSEPTGPMRIVAPRADDVTYRVEVAGDRLLITHNAHGPDFELSQAPLEATSSAQWRPVIPHSDGTRILRADAYEQQIVISLRRQGLTALHILPRTPNGHLGVGEDVTFDESVYRVTATPGPNYDDVDVRMAYTSLLTPPSILSYNVLTRRLRVIKQMRVLDHPERGPFDPDQYEQRREWAEAEDGTKIPISLVGSKETLRGGPAPTVLYGYGAYEFPIEPDFDGLRISLLDRGFVFALAHVRGGGELGRPWYAAGRRLDKINSFTDFLACAHHLIDTGVSDPDRIGAEGTSAGGLVVGAATNLEPELFRAVHADVPYVDPLTTGLDPELPLTVAEWEQWGDPVHDPEAYAYIKSYAPYENVQPARYPAILATASLNDTRVSYAEAAKWIARLRATAKADDDRPILLKTELVAGHGGVTGRYSQWEDAAFRMAWLMDQLGGDAPRNSDAEGEAE